MTEDTQANTLDTGAEVLDLGDFAGTTRVTTPVRIVKVNKNWRSQSGKGNGIAVEFEALEEVEDRTGYVISRYFSLNHTTTGYQTGERRSFASLLNAAFDQPSGDPAELVGEVVEAQISITAEDRKINRFASWTDPDAEDTEEEETGATTVGL